MDIKNSVLWYVKKVRVVIINENKFFYFLVVPRGIWSDDSIHKRALVQKPPTTESFHVKYPIPIPSQRMLSGKSLSAVTQKITKEYVIILIRLTFHNLLQSACVHHNDVASRSGFDSSLRREDWRHDTWNSRGHEARGCNIHYTARSSVREQQGRSSRSWFRHLTGVITSPNCLHLGPFNLEKTSIR